MSKAWATAPTARRRRKPARNSGRLRTLRRLVTSGGASGAVIHSPLADRSAATASAEAPSAQPNQALVGALARAAHRARHRVEPVRRQPGALVEGGVRCLGQQADADHLHHARRRADPNRVTHADAEEGRRAWAEGELVVTVGRATAHQHEPHRALEVEQRVEREVPAVDDWPAPESAGRRRRRRGCRRRRPARRARSMSSRTSGRLEIPHLADPLGCVEGVVDAADERDRTHHPEDADDSGEEGRSSGGRRSRRCRLEGEAGADRRRDRGAGPRGRPYELRPGGARAPDRRVSPSTTPPAGNRGPRRPRSTPHRRRGEAR